MVQTTVFTTRTTLLTMALLGGLTQLATAERKPTSVEEVREQARQSEQQRLQQEQQIQKQAQERKSWLQQAKDAHENLGRLKDMAQSFFRRMDSLLYSDDGKRIARHGSHFSTYVALRSYPYVDLSEIQRKLDEASGYVNQITASSQGPEVGYVPSQEICDGVQTLATWSGAKLKAVEQDLATLNNMLADAPRDIDLAKTETLAAVYERELARRREWEAVGRQQGVLDARGEVVAKYQETARLAEVQHAHARTQAMLAEEQQKNDQLQKESDMRVMRLKQDVETKYAKVQKDYEDTLAFLEDLKKDSELARKIAQREAQRRRDKLTDEEARRDLTAEATSLRVQSLLAPLFGASYYQPLLPAGTTTKGPVSLSRLRDIGAFDTNSIRGQAVLLQVFTSPQDKYRQRWTCSDRIGDLSMEQRDRLVEAQECLIRLGPTLVELGYLAK